jgi:hypothetical protein
MLCVNCHYKQQLPVLCEAMHVCFFHTLSSCSFNAFLTFQHEAGKQLPPILKNT